LLPIPHRIAAAGRGAAQAAAKSPAPPPVLLPPDQQGLSPQMAGMAALGMKAAVEDDDNDIYQRGGVMRKYLLATINCGA